MSFRVALSLIRRNPQHALTVALAFGRGWYYRAKFRLLGRRVVIGHRFRVVGRLDIRGPGTVIFGDNCSVQSTRYATTTPYTHSPAAVIRFGNSVTLTGTRIGCAERVQIGDGATLADARIMDTDFHEVEVYDRPRAQTKGRSKPIFIGANAWLGAATMVLKGVNIGENSVIGAGAVVTNDVPPNVVAIGNPSRVVKHLKGPTPKETFPESRMGSTSNPGGLS